MKYKNLRSSYVLELESDLQTKIKSHLIDFFKNDLDLNEAALSEELELAMHSRVSDLEDTIDIKKILQHL